MPSPEEHALEFLKKLVKTGPFADKVYLVGGSVRDSIMGQPVKDLDLVVTEKDGGIKFADWITKLTGTYKPDANPVTFPRFGTAKFSLRGKKFNGVDLSNVDIETVMTRGEKYSKGSRKPEVEYSSIKADALRRDFTINTLYMNLSDGKIKDPTGRGISDLKNHALRTPTDPNVTFKEDPLRMLRAVRFATKYNWKLARNMVTALKKNSSLLRNISAERIQDELNKILLTKRPSLGMRALTYTGLMDSIIPELSKTRKIGQNVHHKDDVFDHIMEVLDNTPPDLKARLGALFHDIGKPNTQTVDDNGDIHFYDHETAGAKIAEKRLAELKYPRSVIDSVTSLVQNHMSLKYGKNDASNLSDKALRKFVYKMGDDLDPMLDLMHADNISHAEASVKKNQVPNIRKRIQSAMATAKDNRKIDLPVNGHDIMNVLGVRPGPGVKHALDAVKDAWMENPNLSREDALDLVTKKFGTTSNDKNVPADSKKRIRNPKTDNDILIKTALGYDKSHPVRQAAEKYLKSQRK